MSFMLYLLSGSIFILLLVVVIWRRSSARRSIPCPAWLGWLVELDNPLLRNNSAREIMRHLDLHSGMKVLDFGCGPGRLTIPVAKRIGPAGTVTAFDIQPGMLERVRVKAARAGLDNIEFVQGAAGEGKLAKEAYDRVLLVTVLGEIPDRGAALQEIYACLKPGGLLSITEVIADPHFQARKKVLDTARAAGFRERDFFGSRISFTVNLEKP
jgi:ubiquinone/menaquinone biosynthesis C-methylase UbiE